MWGGVKEKKLFLGLVAGLTWEWRANFLIESYNLLSDTTLEVDYRCWKYLTLHH